MDWLLKLRATFHVHVCIHYGISRVWECLISCGGAPEYQVSHLVKWHQAATFQIIATKINETFGWQLYLVGQGS